MSDRATTNYNRQQRLLRRLKDIYSRARVYGLTLERVATLMNEEVYGSDDWKRAPGHVRDFFHGYADCTWENHQNHTEHRYFFEGKWRNHEELNVIFKPDGRSWGEVADCPSGSFYKKDDSDGKPRPYHVSSDSKIFKANTTEALAAAGITKEQMS